MELTREQKIAEARRLRACGWIYREIGEELGVARSTVSSWFVDPNGSKLRARKDSYRGTCRNCGAPTDGSNGSAQAPDRCAVCYGNREAERNERIHEAWARGERAKQIAAAEGLEAKTVLSLIQNHRQRGGDVPMHTLPHSNHAERWQRIRELWADGATLRQIAEEVGSTRGSVWHMVQQMRRRGYDLEYRDGRAKAA